MKRCWCGRIWHGGYWNNGIWIPGRWERLTGQGLRDVEEHYDEITFIDDLCDKHKVKV
jgi:hypothetical protein